MPIDQNLYKYTLNFNNITRKCLQQYKKLTIHNARNFKSWVNDVHISVK